MSNSFQSFLKGAVLLSFGQVMVYGLSFVRNLILARLLTKADFGLAAALSLTMSLLELVQQMGLGMQVVQAPEGNDHRFQAVAHNMQFCTGIISAVLTIVAAYPMAFAFHVPHLTWAFASLALIPLARGSMHLDMARMQRQYIYSPSVLTEVVPQGLATAAAWPLAVWMGDFRAVLWIMLGKELTTVGMSFIVAKRPYRWAWDKSLVKRMLSFSWPLLLNGLVMFACQQGDQMIIGSAFSLTDLAPYSIAFTISSIPFYIFGYVGKSLMFPIMSRYQDQPQQFERYYRQSVELSAIFALLLMGPFIVSGDSLVYLLYGPKYSSGIRMLMIIFGAIMALRFLRWAPTLAAMSKADTINQFIANLSRATSLPIALMLLALVKPSVEAIAACGLAGEMIAIIVSIILVRKRQMIGFTAYVRPALFLLGGIIIMVAINQFPLEGTSLWKGGVAIFTLWTLVIIIALFVFPNLLVLTRHAFAHLSISLSSFHVRKNNNDAT